MVYKAIKLTDMADNKAIYISLDKITSFKEGQHGGTAITIGSVVYHVKESVQIVLALLEERDTFAAKLLYDRPKSK